MKYRMNSELTLEFRGDVLTGIQDKANVQLYRQLDMNLCRQLRWKVSMQVRRQLLRLCGELNNEI